MPSLWSAVMYAFCVLTAGVTMPCEGCFYDDHTWGSGSIFHVYTYIPGAGDEMGVCDSDCSSTPCLFSGSLSVRNNSNAAIEIRDKDGVLLNTIAPGASRTFAVEAKSYCGTKDSADPWWYATPIGGGAAASGYIFSCSICTT